MVLSFALHRSHKPIFKTTDDCGGQDGLRLRARLHYALKRSLGTEVPIGV